MSAAASVVRPSFDTTRESTRAKAREVQALVEQGFSVAAISERVGFTEARIRQLLTIARAETSATDQGTEFAHRRDHARAEKEDQPAHDAGSRMGYDACRPTIMGG